MTLCFQSRPSDSFMEVSSPSGLDYLASYDHAFTSAKRVAEGFKDSVVLTQNSAGVSLLTIVKRHNSTTHFPLKTLSIAPLPLFHYALFDTSGLTSVMVQCLLMVQPVTFRAYFSPAPSTSTAMAYIILMLTMVLLLSLRRIGS